MMRRLTIPLLLLLLSACALAPESRTDGPPLVKGIEVIVMLPDSLVMTDINVLSGANKKETLKIVDIAWANDVVRTIEASAPTPPLLAAQSFVGPDKDLAEAVAKLKALPRTTELVLLVEPDAPIPDPILRTGTPLGGIGAMHLARVLGNGPTHIYAFLRVSLRSGKDFSEIAVSHARATYDLARSSRFRTDDFRWPADWSRASEADRKQFADIVRILINQDIEAALQELNLVKKPN